VSLHYFFSQNAPCFCTLETTKKQPKKNPKKKRNKENPKPKQKKSDFLPSLLLKFFFA